MSLISAAPAHRSTSAARVSATSRFFGHGSKRRQRLRVVPAAERPQRRGGESDVVDRRVAEGVEPPLQPACCDARVAHRVLERDQCSELEQVAERWPRDLGAQRRLGDEQVAVLDRLLEDRPWVTLGCDPALRFPGPDGTFTLTGSASIVGRTDPAPK